MTVDEDGKFVDEVCVRWEETAAGSGKKWQVVEPVPVDSVQAVAPKAGEVGATGGVTEVPEGSVAVITDNRRNAKLVVVPVTAVMGKASLVWFSTAGPRGVRWGRFGERVR
jgi:hypothetical protein